MPGGVGRNNPNRGALSDEAGRREDNPVPAGNVSTAAGITRSEWQHFLDFYRPLEDQVLDRAMQTDFTKEGNVAGQTARAGVQASSGILERNVSRSGATLTAEERSAIGRRKNISLATSAARAENTTRRGLSDSRTDLLQKVVGIGRGVANTASAGLNSVADMAAQREAEYQQGKANATSTNMSAAATAAGLLFAI
jgi:hypothetical protein